MTIPVAEPLAVYKRLWGYTRRYFGMFALGIVGVGIDASMQAAFIKFMEPLIDRVFVGKDSAFGLWQLRGRLRHGMGGAARHRRSAAGTL
jgi:hypothetical protein